MNYRVLQDLDKRKFNSPEVLRLTIFRTLKIVFFCLSLTFLLWFFLIQDYLLFTFLLGTVLGISAEMLTNSRKTALKLTPPEKESYFTGKKTVQENKVEF